MLVGLQVLSSKKREEEEEEEGNFLTRFCISKLEAHARLGFARIKQLRLRLSG